MTNDKILEVTTGKTQWSCENANDLWEQLQKLKKKIRKLTKLLNIDEKELDKE